MIREAAAPARAARDRLCRLLCLALGVGVVARADVSPGVLEVFPPGVVLDNARDRQSLVVRIIDAGGITRDVTAEAQLSCSNPALAKYEDGLLTPLADGEGVLSVAVAGLTRALPIAVRSAAIQPGLSFRLDVLPALTKSGCNNGSCHGSARGQDGFHLSLFGYDPEGDYQTLLRQLPGRRVNLALPEESLIVQKALGLVPHTGGRRFEPDDERNRAVMAWLAAGAPADPPDVARVTALEIFPQDVVLAAGGAGQRVSVRAKYSDATDRDVTSLAVLISNNEPAAKLDGSRIVSGERGAALIIARFDAFSVGTQVIVVPADAPEPALPAALNYVDERVHEQLRRLRIEPSGLCGDEEFLRRASLDIAGVLPTPAEHARFVSDSAPDKREKLVDALLQRKEFVELWVLKWAERLQVRSSQQVSYKAMLLYYNWLQDRIAGNVPIDQIVRELIGASGGTFGSPATNFYQGELDTLKLTENVAQALLGTRIQCAQCHNHPFDRWTMDDYYGFAAFFAQIGRKVGDDPRETIVFNSGGGEVNHPVGGRAMAPRFLGGPAPDPAGRDRRALLAEWLTAPDNRMFARAVANFTWANFFARGIVEPVDDVRVSNPPVNEALLQALADRLVEYKFDLRRLVRDICTSRTYQLSTRTNASNAGDNANFSHACVRRIRAEVLLDAISQATGTRDKFPGLPLGARAVQVADGNVSNYFLTTFGRAKRESVCTCEVVMEPNLSQALHLINGETVHQKISQGQMVARLLADGLAPPQVAQRLYVLCLSRNPTAEEQQQLATILTEPGQEPPSVLNDLFWALLNSKEFMFNH